MVEETQNLAVNVDETAMLRAEIQRNDEEIESQRREIERQREEIERKEAEMAALRQALDQRYTHPGEYAHGRFCIKGRWSCCGGRGQDAKGCLLSGNSTSSR